MSEIVSTPISFFDLEIEYQEPNFKAATERAPVAQAIWDALKPWNITMDDLELVTTGKLSEQGIRFRLPKKSSMFFFGAASCRFVRDNTGWDIAEETITIIDAAVQALLSTTSSPLCQIQNHGGHSKTTKEVAIQKDSCATCPATTVGA